jgi:hypothetical protein
MADDQISIKNSDVTGDIAGGNIDKSTRFEFSGSKSSYMNILISKFNKEQESNSQLNEFIEDLDYYYNKRKDDVIGLEEKLKNAGRNESFIEFAIDAKDRYHRKLYKRFKFSESAQKINVHLLGLVISYFENEIHPLIIRGDNEQIINSMISERLIKPLLNELDENCLDFNAHDINGMLHFLTGNCHIKWT